MNRWVGCLLAATVVAVTACGSATTCDAAEGQNSASGCALSWANCENGAEYAVAVADGGVTCTIRTASAEDEQPLGSFLFRDFCGSERPEQLTLIDRHCGVRIHERE